MSNPSQDTRPSTTTSSPWSTDAVGVGAAVVCAMVTWLSTRAAGLDLAVELGGDEQQVGGWAVALTAAASATVGFVVLRVLERVTPSAMVVWTGLVLVVTVLSFLGPLGAVTPGAVGALISLHAVVAAVVIASAWTSRRRHGPWAERGRAGL